MTLTEKLLALAATLEAAGGERTVAALHEAVDMIDTLSEQLDTAEDERDALKAELVETTQRHHALSQQVAVMTRALTALFDNVPRDMLRDAVQDHERNTRSARQSQYYHWNDHKLSGSLNIDPKAFLAVGVS